MRDGLTQEQKQNLKNMYYQVLKDFEDFPFIQTTEDIFKWREAVKEANGNDGNLRNEEIEKLIAKNESLELLYSWTKFYRMVDRAKAGLYLAKIEHNIEDNDDYKIKAAGMLHKHLVSKNKDNVDQLFGIFRVEGLDLGIKYPTIRTINTPYEFEKAIVKEDEREPWPATLFVTLLKAYGISQEDLLTVGREAEKLGNKYIKEIEETYPKQERTITYVKRNKSFPN